MKNKYSDAEKEAFIERYREKCDVVVDRVRNDPYFTEMPDYPAEAFAALSDEEIMKILIETCDLIGEEKRRGIRKLH